MKQLYIGIWLVWVFGLTSCEMTDKSQQQAENPINIRVREGTNMAAALSPNKKELVLDVQGVLWLMPITGGEAVPITDELGDCHEPAWSPDGETIAFHSYRDGNYHIWSIKKDGTGLKQLTTGAFDDREPVWTPDGAEIIFSSDKNGDYDLWKINLATAEIQAVTSGPANEYSPAISPDGHRIAFISDGQEPGIYVKEKGQESLIMPSAMRLAAPSWNITSEQITFIGYERNTCQLFSVNYTTRAVETLVEAGEDIFPFKVQWLTDTSFLYTANGLIQKRHLNTNKNEIIPFEVSFVLDRADYKRKEYDFDNQDSRAALGIIGPDISPDGHKFAFAAVGNLYVQEDNEKATPLTDDPYVEADPDWSPDGKKLAYVTDETGTMQVWIMDIQSKEKQQLTTGATAGISAMPAWSPRGDKIAFFYRDDELAWGRWRLAIADVASGTIQFVPTPTLFFPSKPSWSPSGDIIALMAANRSSTRFREGHNEFLLISVSDGTSRFVSPSPYGNPGLRAENGPVWSPDGNYFAYIQSGFLWIVSADKTGNIVGQPKQITRELADKISWTADSKHLLYLATDRLKKVAIHSGEISTFDINLLWKPTMPEKTYVIRAGRLFNGIDSNYLQNVDIVIAGNRIKEITRQKTHGDLKIIDASDQVVIPGLFESHTHQHISDGEQLGRIWLANGITSIRETGADPYDAIERREAWSSEIRPGPRAFITGQLMDGNRVYYGLSNTIENQNHIRLEIDRADKLDYDLLKTYVRMSDSIQKQVTAEAHRIGIPVSSHELFPATEYNVDAVEHTAGTSRRGYSQRQSAMHQIYEDVIKLTAQSGIRITPTIVMGGFLKMNKENPALHQNIQYQHFFSSSYRKKWVDRALRSDYTHVEGFLKEIALFKKYGANITAGTDSPQVPYGTSLHAELWLFNQAGLSPFQTLQTATINAARLIGVEKDLGSVEVDKLADLVIVDGDPLQNISDTWNVDRVIKNGRVYLLKDLLTNY